MQKILLIKMKRLRQKFIKYRGSVINTEQITMMVKDYSNEGRVYTSIYFRDGRIFRMIEEDADKLISLLNPYEL